VIAHQVDPAVAARVRARHIGQGVLDYQDEERRVYPEGSVGAQVVGFAGLENRGLEGAELQFDAVLASRPGRDVVVQDPNGSVLRRLRHDPGKPGRDVRLTLDRDIQASVERVVAETRERWKAKSAMAVVLDPRTGGILAMASAPGIPTGGYATSSKAERRIRPITDWYEPGSTFKAMTIGAALEMGKVTPQTTFVIPSSIHRYDRTVWDAEMHPTETMTVSDILAHSSNVGAITIGLNVITPPVFSQWMHRLGFGKRTGVDLPGEATGSVLPFDEWSGASIMNMPIGVGVAVTPLQMAAFYAGIADGGLWRQPHILERIDGRGAPRRKTRRLFAPETNASLVKMLEPSAQIPGYSVAGKTGTTQKIDPKTHSYCGSPGARCEYHASFVGFVPARHPRAVVLVMVDEPQGQYYGAVVAAPAFKEIAATTLQVLRVPPDRPSLAAP
jgi:cell division protein FtsI (penicillin-binding protein 3)/stage V sporulation protein D (sporulation-specific penicillin-binding protein)